MASLKTATHPWWAPLPVTPRRSPPSGKGACLLGQPAACQPEEHCFLWACRASPWAREVAPGHPPRLLGALAATVPAAAALRRPGRLPLSRPGEATSASLPLRVACRCHSAFSVRPLPVPGRFEVERRSLGWTSTVRTQPRVHGLSPPRVRLGSFCFLDQRIYSSREIWKICVRYFSNNLPALRCR